MSRRVVNVICADLRINLKSMARRHDVWLHAFLTSTVQRGKVQALRLCTGRTAHRASRGIALLVLDHDTKRG